MLKVFASSSIGSGMDHPAAPSTAYDWLADELARQNVTGFIHIGDRFDDDMRYLTRFTGPDRPYAFVFADGTATLCAPTLFTEQAHEEFPGDYVQSASESTSFDPAGRALDVLEDTVDGDEIIVPPQLRLQDAERLRSAGYALETTTAVTEARVHKSDTEIACIASVEAAAQQGMRRAEAILAEAEPDGNQLSWSGMALTTEGLRREINGTLARNGVSEAGNSVIGAGKSCADLHFTGDDPIHPGESIVIDLSPRGPHGYYGDFTRTFVVGEPDDWIASAYRAVVAAQDAAFDVLTEGPGTIASRVHAAAATALTDHGFEVGDVEVGMYHGTGHGVGVGLHERPSLGSDVPLEVGHVFSVEPGVYDPDRGGVRIEDLVVMTESGYRNLTEYPRSMTPRA